MGIIRTIVSLHQNPKSRARVAVFLFPLLLASPAYGAVMRIRRWCYRVGLFRTERISPVVVCVGNITTGGTGKTPAVIHLARRLRDAGVTTAVISRGYGYTVSGDYLVVSGPDGVRRQPGGAPDEALMTARKVPGVPVVVSPSRYLAGKAAAELFGARVVVMDDGFQHFGLFRDVDILVLDSANPVGNGLVLPAGPLREPLRGAQRTDVVWLSGEGSGELPKPLSDALRGKPVVRGRPAVEGLMTLSGKRLSLNETAGKRAVAFAGIARPGRFFETVDGLGMAAVGRQSFSDHHTYTERDVDGLNRRAAETGADLFVTTEKDLARLPAGAPFSGEVAAIVMGLLVTGDEPLITMILEKVREKDG
jgi:tetraacyldisaccharide 4'-kinase